MLCLAILGAASPNPNTASLDVQVAGLRSAKGMLQLCLTREPAAFPDCKSGHAVKRTVPASSPTLRIDGLPPGSYALAVIHDENANARLDTFAGIPREGFGFSRNPAIGFGPPRFDRAAFAVAEDTPPQQVRMRYLL